MKRTVTAVAVMAACVCAHAEGSNWRFLAGIGIAGGGEQITAGTITTIGTTESRPFQINVGDGMQFRVGADYRLLPRVTLQGSVAYSTTGPSGTNGSFTFTTVPLEFLGFIDITTSLRLGGGVRKSQADMKTTGVAEDWIGSGTYTGSDGGVVELQYLTPFSAQDKTQFGVSLRYVTETFTHDRTGTRFNGNHYELAAALYF
jgi:hypothetical protein